MSPARLPFPLKDGPSNKIRLALMGLLLFLFSTIGCEVGSERASNVPSADPPPASQFIYPRGTRNDVVVTNPFLPFAWQPVSSASGYYLQIGTAPGLQDVFAVGELPPEVTSWPVDNLLPGSYYARLGTQTIAGWGYSDIRFMTLPQPLPPDESAFHATIEQLTASVRLSTQGLTNVPVPGTPLAQEVSRRRRTSADCTDYAYALSQVLQQNAVYSRIVMMTLDGTSTEAHTVLEYYDPFWQEWWIADPTFGVVYFDDSVERGQGALELNQYVVAESWNLIKPKFVTPNGSLYMTSYYMDPITLYLNVVPQGSTLEQSVIHDPKQFLIPYTTGAANPHGVYLFGFDTDAESMQLDDPVGQYTSNSGVIPIDADDSTPWSGAYTLNDNWSILSAPPDTQAYTFRRVLF